MKAHFKTWLTLPLFKNLFQEKKPLLEVICSSPFQEKEGWLKLAHDLKAVWIRVSNPLFLVGAGTACAKPCCVCLGVGFSAGPKGTAWELRKGGHSLPSAPSYSLCRSSPGPVLPYTTGSAELLVTYFANSFEFFNALNFGIIEKTLVFW